MGGSARSYLVLRALVTVLQWWDDHPHHRLPARFLVSTMAVLPGSPTLRARDLDSTGREHLGFSWVFVV